MSKRALITGISGQDGSYLAEFLLERGYEVHGIVRRIALENPAHRLSRLAGCAERITFHGASLESLASLFRVVQTVQPDELYHLAAQSFVSYSFEDEFSTFDTNVRGTHHMLSCLKDAAPECRFYFAGSSEMFGKARATPQNEDTPFHPRSLYGISKVAGFELTRNYREAHGLFAAAGILFNHESPRRGREFVTRKITLGAARIKLGLATELRLGNLDARRDWGYAPEYVAAMWRMLQLDEPRDLVIGTGQSHSVREFVSAAFAALGLDWEPYVHSDERFFRPAEVNVLEADPREARAVLDWDPQVRFEELVERMVRADFDALQGAGEK